MVSTTGKAPVSSPVTEPFSYLRATADVYDAVAELGCGPGRVTAHLRDLGLDVFGVDLSPVMIDLAREAYPELPRRRHWPGGSSRLPDGRTGRCPDGAAQGPTATGGQRGQRFSVLLQMFFGCGRCVRMQPFPAALASYMARSA